MIAGGESVTFQQAGAKVLAGGQTFDDWDNPTDVLTVLCAVGPVESSEGVAPGRLTSSDRLRLYMAGTVTIDPAWRCTVRGAVYQVLARPAQWVHPATGWVAGTTVDVLAVEG